MDGNAIKAGDIEPVDPAGLSSCDDCYLEMSLSL